MSNKFDESNENAGESLEKTDNSFAKKKTWKAWGWLVVAASFYCIAILDDVGYTTEILLDALLKDLGGGRAEMSLANSL